jgi:ribosomal protein L12E/L44/L45/RPP1/RPP2
MRVLASEASHIAPFARVSLTTEPNSSPHLLFSFALASRNRLHTSIMTIPTSLDDLSDSQKEEMVASLAVLLVGKGEGEMTAESVQAVATAAGCSVSPVIASLFARVAASAEGGVDAYMPGPGGGGGGGGGGGAAAGGGGGGAAEAAQEAKQEEEEEEMAAPAVDMFGGDEGGDY